MVKRSMRLNTARFKCLRVLQEMEIKRYKSLNWIRLDWLLSNRLLALKCKAFLLLGFSSQLKKLARPQNVQEKSAHCKPCLSSKSIGPYKV